MTDDGRETIQVTVPKQFAERLERQFPEGLTNSERLRMAAANGVAERAGELTEDGMVRAIERALRNNVVAVQNDGGG